MYSLILLPIFLIFRFFPPRGRNHLYGYRTPYSLQSDEHFLYANKVAGNVFLTLLGISLAIQLVADYMWKGKTPDLFAQSMTVVTLALSFILTEIIIRRKPLAV